MNALFHLNMAFQQAAVEAKRLQVALNILADAPPKDSAAYAYLKMIFKQGTATSQQLNTVRNGNAKMPYDTIKLWIKRNYISFEKLSNFGGIYRPCEGITAEMLGIDLKDES